jgi:type II secretory ATPase GspE/PulE/Tfp pilus assembly ATPase PilB-like protein
VAVQPESDAVEQTGIRVSPAFGLDLAGLESILKDMGVKPTHIRIALQRAELTGESLSRIMRDFGFLSGEQVAEAISKQTGYPYYRAEELDRIDPAQLKGLKIKAFRRFVPVGRDEEGSLILAVPDVSLINDARNEFFQERKIRVVIASDHTIQTIFRRFFADTEAKFDGALAEYIKSQQANRRAGMETEEGGTGVQQIFIALLRHACYSGASDLYLYKSEHIGVIKLKINGVGQIFRVIESDLFDRLLNKLVTENTKAEDLRREPREAIVSFSAEDARKHEDIVSRFGFRLELTETRGIRNAVVRILDKQASATDLNRIGFDEITYKAIKRVSGTSTGLILVTGPTGSGKTTTLYAVLKNIDPVERSIQSIENPIEYRHGLWQQYELRKDSTNEGDEYNKWLKALLRNAPDVILVGEVRDRGVAQILMDAANTGHLAFATLHTNNATMALARMRALEVDMNTLASILLGILAQRLIRVLCPRCRQKDNNPETLEFLNKHEFLEHEPRDLYKAGTGCSYCDFTGFRGRRMIYEFLDVNHEVQDLIEKDEPPSTIARAGLPLSRTMWACGLRLVCGGTTSYDELRRVAKPES